MKSGSLPKGLFFLLILCLLLPRISPATQVIAWGENNYGQTNVPAGLTNAVAIAAGEYISLALRSDGTVIAWGENTITNVPAGLANVIAIAAGEQHCLALKNDGTVIAWGNNSNGQTNVPAGLSNVVAIAAGGNYSVAVKNNGKVIGWGAFTLSNPVSGLSNVSAIAIGHFPCIALETNGTVTSLSPVDYGLTNVPPGLSNVQALSAGFTHILALVSNGTCIAWGDDSEGATNVPNNLSNSLVSISAGYGYSLGLTTNNIIASWGNVPIPTSVPAHLTNVIALAAGPYYSLALIDNGAPVIFPQPVAQSIYSGNPVSFLVGGAGVGAISYQWLFNGTNISGATNASLVLTASAASAGNYSVLVSNVYGTSVSSNALLTVTFAAPTITAQPTNQYYYNGSNAVFSVSTSGSQPFIYQWQFDGTNLAGATNSSLVINMQPTNEGYYNVIITNAYGSVTSTPAYINMFDVAAFLNATNLYWSSSSNAPWYYNPRSSLNGMMGVMSGQVTNNSTTLQTFIVGPGAITFFEDLVTSRPLKNQRFFRFLNFA